MRIRRMIERAEAASFQLFARTEVKKVLRY
jgi:hypothetical protein